MTDIIETTTRNGCPFCGSNLLDFTQEPAGNKTFFAVMCVTCGAQGPSCVCIDDMDDAWNRRGIAAVTGDDLSRWRAQPPGRLVASFRKALMEAEKRGRCAVLDAIEDNEAAINAVDVLACELAQQHNADGEQCWKAGIAALRKEIME